MADAVIESTSAPSSAPATSAPSSAGSSTPSPSRPSSFSDALKTAETAEQAEASVPSDAPLAPLETQQTPPGVPKVETKWERAVKNVRQQVRQEVENEWKTKVGWAEGIPREPVVEALNWRKQAKENPGQFIENMLEEGLGNPRVAPVIYGLLNRLMGQVRQQQQVQQAPRQAEIPESAQYVDPSTQKRFVPIEFVQQLAEQLEQKLEQKFEPQLQTVDAIARREHERAVNAQLQTFSINTLKEVRQLPHFSTHEKEIKAVFAQMRMPDAHPATAANYLYKAYQQVVGPRIEQLSQQQVYANLKQTAAASSMNPATTGAPTQAKRPKTFGEALRQAEARTIAR